MKAGSRSDRAAFTLVEIMLAIAIFAGVMGAIYSSWLAIVRGARIARDATAGAQRARIAMIALREAIVSTELFVQSADRYGFVADTTGEYASLSLVAHLPESFPGSGMFPGLPVRRVTFSVRSDGGAANELIMMQTPLLAVNFEEASSEMVLAPDVSIFSLEFWDWSVRDWVPEWIETNQIPSAVRVHFAAASTRTAKSTPADELLLTLSIPSTAVLPAYQLGPGGPAQRRPQLGPEQTRPTPAAPPRGRSGSSGRSSGFRSPFSGSGLRPHP